MQRKSSTYHRLLVSEYRLLSSLTAPRRGFRTQNRSRECNILTGPACYERGPLAEMKSLGPEGYLEKIDDRCGAKRAVQRSRLSAPFPVSIPGLRRFVRLAVLPSNCRTTGIVLFGSRSAQPFSRHPMSTGLLVLYIIVDVVGVNTLFPSRRLSLELAKGPT